MLRGIDSGRREAHDRQERVSRIWTSAARYPRRAPTLLPLNYENRQGHGPPAEPIAPTAPVTGSRGPLTPTLSPSGRGRRLDRWRRGLGEGPALFSPRPNGERVPVGRVRGRRKHPQQNRPARPASQPPLDYAFSSPTCRPLRAGKETHWPEQFSSDRSKACGPGAALLFGSTLTFRKPTSKLAGMPRAR